MENPGSGECPPPQKRNRSSTASGSHTQDKAASTAPKQPQKREFTEEDWKASEHRWETVKEEREAAERTREAEETRRRNLEPHERLQEDGAALQLEIESNPDMLVFLETSRSQNAQCHAKDDCFYVRNEAAFDNFIWDKSRIRVNGVRDETYWGVETHYYHVICFNYMISVEDLIPSKFKLEGSWGLMVRKWYQHKGCIDLDKIAAYIAEYKAYEERETDRCGPHHVRALHHGPQCDAESDPTTCSCPPAPRALDKPVLRDYTTGPENKVELSDVLSHQDVDEMRYIHVFTWGVGFEVVAPETEVQDAGGKETT
ncbi:hypothetical protein G7Z17_g4538 [Cylindrodendrum hubeiense]|uniref:Uncharacterized protein n=1 Tax=Cylindrodendrum hubeiense TaxID=595255 RepID=A0A9P5L9V9_9HYPO|nr:hypothetical protein G7Z17_g4538 [Cylindrodendrum hubeiense]